MPIVEWDENFKVIKLNPLINWSEDDVWNYIKENKVPYNKLHDNGFPSIGCEPCTRAIKDGEDIRAGRWWWENPEHKECGLYFSKEREVVEYMGTKIMVDDERMPEELRKTAKKEMVRFRTLGCYPLTGAVNSEATTLPEIIQEMLICTTSERQGRLIDSDGDASMEKKKQEGYF
jgi:3'-phosphoadenosine 5'-phosphosulfate sulfotransferase (PAPS reductase)/FAD synthetase